MLKDLGKYVEKEKNLLPQLKGSSINKKVVPFPWFLSMISHHSKAESGKAWYGNDLWSILYRLIIVWMHTDLPITFTT